MENFAVTKIEIFETFGRVASRLRPPDQMNELRTRCWDGGLGQKALPETRLYCQRLSPNTTFRTWQDKKYCVAKLKRFDIGPKDGG